MRQQVAAARTVLDSRAARLARQGLQLLPALIQLLQPTRCHPAALAEFFGLGSVTGIDARLSQFSVQDGEFGFHLADPIREGFELALLLAVERALSRDFRRGFCAGALPLGLGAAGGLGFDG